MISIVVISRLPEWHCISSKNGNKITCRKLIITGGGKTYPVLGSDGSLFNIAKQLGHTIIDPVPCAVPLVVKDPMSIFFRDSASLPAPEALLTAEYLQKLKANCSSPNTDCPVPAF